MNKAVVMNDSTMFKTKGIDRSIQRSDEQRHKQYVQSVRVAATLINGPDLTLPK